jgi:anti-anti-sigma regulatory factor
MPVLDITLGDLNYTLGIGQENTFLRLAGNVGGSHNARKLNVVFQRAIQHMRGKLFLSLQGCYTMDADTVAFFAEQRKALGIQARDIILVEVPSQIQAVMDKCQISSLFEIFPSLHEAEKKYGAVVSN